MTEIYKSPGPRPFVQLAAAATALCAASLPDAVHRITRALGNADSLEDGLQVVVHDVKAQLAVDACSVYLADLSDTGFILAATDGLDPLAVGTMRLGRGDGLVGMVVESRHPVSLSDAHAHPRFRHLPQLGGRPYHAFLGVAICHHEKVLGALVVRQSTERAFSREEGDFLSAAASGVAALAQVTALAEAKTVADGRSRGAPVLVLHGTAGAPGVGIGEGVLPSPAADLDAVPERVVEDVEAEELAFQEAVSAVRAELLLSGQRVASEMPAEAHAMFGVYIELLDDDELFADTLERIRAGVWAGSAMQRTIKEHSRAFEGTADPYLRARAEDLRGLGRRVLLRLQSGEAERTIYPPRCVLVGEEISIVRIADVPAGHLAGIVCTRGSPFSHTAILARTLRIPAVLGVGGVSLDGLAGRQLLVDGDHGRVFIDPTPKLVKEFNRRTKQRSDSTESLIALRNLPAETPDGACVALLANVGMPSDIANALDSGAEGIGLFRTEFTFMVRDSFPSEQTQYQVYRDVLASFAPRPVTMRTLDVGGDKGLPYFPIEENNSFLGWRGIRLTLDNPGIFLTQLRALLRANAGLGNLQILLPMISSVREVDEVRGLLARATAEVVSAGQPLAVCRLGAMVEVPSAIYQMEALSKRVDFFSVGTNDLTQYLLAVDRTNARVSHRFDSLHPGVLRAINDAVRNARDASRPISVCGEMAGDPQSAVLLMGMGIDTLSMASSCIPPVKRALRKFTRRQAQLLVVDALGAEDPSEVRRMLSAAFELAGLGDGRLGPARAV